MNEPHACSLTYSFQALKAVEKNNFFFFNHTSQEKKKKKKLTECQIPIIFQVYFKSWVLF